MKRPKKAPKHRRRRSGKKAPPPELTSHPTSRNAQMDTRAWLLHEYGPVCAYCGIKHSARSMTLDHVAPRRGQIAYDRRDNLVLACRDCNAKKKDMPPLAFLLAVRTRAPNLARYGAHLSKGLVEMARSLTPREVFGSESEDDSPYRE